MLFNMIFILHRWATMKHDETWWNAMKQAKSLKWVKQVVSSFGPFLGFSYLCSIKTNCSHYGEDRFSMPLRIVCHPVRLLFQGGAVGQDGAHQEGWQWPSQASPRLLLDSLEEDEVAAGEWRHKTGWWFPLPAKDFGTASLPPALVHSARWYLMRLYDTNAQLSGWTVKEVYKSQVFDVKKQDYSLSLHLNKGNRHGHSKTGEGQIVIDSCWGRIDDKRLWARELPDLAYKEIPSIEHIERSMRQLVSYLTRWNVSKSRGNVLLLGRFPRLIACFCWKRRRSPSPNGAKDR